ncbi:unnamed protein product [Heligmosomoides polygyrus]|uniref:DUF5615 domain-containing protein n=1 Tax=Heligmosomoides polygyrus TaxID=6339 RepID=A0A183GH39_HELPZ|nr:unnamed protein product [Heligmosomoides polygyrus]
MEKFFNESDAYSKVLVKDTSLIQHANQLRIRIYAPQQDLDVLHEMFDLERLSPTSLPALQPDPYRWNNTLICKHDQ